MTNHTQKKFSIIQEQKRFLENYRKWGCSDQSSIEDETNSYAESVLDLLVDSNAVVPSIWPLEVTNVLLVAERRQRLSEADCSRIIDLLKELPITVEQEKPARILSEIFFLARQQQLSSYDASCLDLAMRTGLPMATQNTRLLNAARNCQVPILNEE